MRTRSGRSNQVGQGAATAGATATTDSGDTSANATAPIPVSSTSISPPYVTDVSHAALVKWKRERQEYEEAIEARCSVTGEDMGKALRSVKNSFNRQLLSTLCRLEWGTTVEEVTDARIIVELDKIVGNVMNDAILDVDAIFDDELKMNLRERDCNILRKHLEPAALREAVDTHLRIVDASSKSDESALYMLVKEKALEQERVEKTSERGRSVQAQTKPAAASQGKPRTGCFHCGKDHWLSHGSDMNIISRKHVDLLREQDAAVVLVELDAPITSRAVGGALLTSTHTVEVRLTLNTAAGPVRCQDAKRCLIVETDEDE
eukprot:jgi/Phyca11/107728/e_gw1.14.659.1